MSDLLATERDAQARTEYLNRAPRASERQAGAFEGAFSDVLPALDRLGQRIISTGQIGADLMEWSRNNPTATEQIIRQQTGASDILDPGWAARARDLPRIAEPDPVETALSRAAERATERRIQLRPDPSRVGLAGQVLGGVAEFGGAAALGAFGGTPGMAATSSIIFGESGRQDFIAEGVDPETARVAGAIEGITAGASVFFPASLASARSTFLARVLERSASGAALNVGIGAASRESVGGYLRAQGYEQQASRYRALDAQSVIADAVLGAAFGSMGPRVESDAPRDVPTPDETDAALDIATERRARVDSAPGIPLDLQAEAKHAEAMRTAERQAEEGEPIDVGTFSEEDMAGFARHPEDFEAEQRVEAAIRETLEAEGYSDLQADVERLQAQARAAGIDDALYSRGAVRTPGEAREFVANAVARNDESYFFRTPDDTVVVGLPVVLDRRASVFPDWTFQSAAQANKGDATKSYWYRERSGPPSAAEAARILRRVFASVRDHAEAFGPRSYRFQTLESGMGRVYARLMQEAPIPGYELRALGGDEYVLARQPGAPAPTGKSLAQYGEDGTSLPLMSAGARPGFSTTQTLTSQLSQEFGADWEALSRSGKVEVVQSTKDLPVSDLENVRGVKGLHLRGSGKTYLVANNIRPDQAKGVLLHEIGVHHGMPEMLGKRGFNAVMRAVDRLVEEGQPDAVAARDAAEAYAGRDDLIPEETVAYLIEYAPDLPLTQSILSQIRQWLVKTFGSTFGMRLTVDDIRALALASLRRVAEQGRREVGDWTPLRDDAEPDVVLAARDEGYQGQDTGEAKEWLDAKAKGLPMDEASRMQRARERRVTDIRTPRGELHETIVNPTEADILRLTRPGRVAAPGLAIERGVPISSSRGVRYIKDLEGNIYVGNSYDVTHHDLVTHYGLPNRGLLDGGEIVRLPDGTLELQNNDGAMPLPRGWLSGRAAFDPSRSGESDLLASRGAEPWRELIGSHPWINSPSRAILIQMAGERKADGSSVHSNEDIAAATGYKSGASVKMTLSAARKAGVNIAARMPGGGKDLPARIISILERGVKEGVVLSGKQVAARLDTTEQSVASTLRNLRSGRSKVVTPDLRERLRRVTEQMNAIRAKEGRQTYLYSRAGRETYPVDLLWEGDGRAFGGDYNVWNDAGLPPLKESDVRRAMRDVKRGLRENREFSSEQSGDWSNMQHARRIATLMTEGWSEPIIVRRLSQEPQKNPDGSIDYAPIVIDGKHRLAAARMRGDANIAVRWADPKLTDVENIAAAKAASERDAAYHDLEPVQQALVDDPTMTIPTEEGMVPARDAMELVNIEAKSARELAKGFPAAMKCAIKHGGMLAAANRNMARDIVVGQGLGLAASIPVGYGVAMGARAASDYETEPRNQFNRQRARMEEGMALDRQGYLDAPVVPYGEEQGGPRRVDWNAPAGDAGWDRNPATGNPFKSIPADAPSPVETVENDPFAGLGGPEDE